MREPIKDRVRLEHIVEAADNTSRMKKDGMPTKQISRYTGLTAEEIERL
jgi:hypothetical protein